MRKIADWCWAVAYCFAITLIVSFQIVMYGERWTFGPYLLPRSVLAPDGLHFRNGMEIDWFWLWAHRNGVEEVMEVVIYGGLFLLAYLSHWHEQRTERRHK